MLPHWTESDVVVDGLEFHYVRTGNGRTPPLLLLHGFSDNGLCWLPMARELESRFDLVMLDARGHGRSARIHPNETIDNAADAAKIIEALGLQKPIVIGHSMGGLAATELGARFPDLVSGLILEDPAWIDPSPDAVPLAENPFFNWLLNLDGVPVEEIIAQGKMTNPIGSESEFLPWAESKKQLDKNILGVVRFDKPWRELVAALTVPTLLVTAVPERGAIVSPAAAQEAASLSPFIQIAAIPNVGHNIRRENFADFMQAVQTFLSQSQNI